MPPNIYYVALILLRLPLLLLSILLLPNLKLTLNITFLVFLPLYLVDFKALKAKEQKKA